jgi:hypothetical protein
VNDPNWTWCSISALLGVTLLDRRLKRIAEANKPNKVIEAKPMIDGEKVALDCLIDAFRYPTGRGLVILGHH